MDIKTSESVKILKEFEGSKRRRGQRKRDGGDDNSVVTDGSSGSCHQVRSNRASLQNLSRRNNDGVPDENKAKREHDRSPSESRTNSSRRTRRSKRESCSLALKAGNADTPRSESPLQEELSDLLPKEKDSFIYAFLEEAIKKDKRKQQSRQNEEEKRRGKEKRDRSVERSHEYRRDRTRTRLTSVPSSEGMVKHGHSRRHHSPRKHRHHHRHHDRDDRDKTPRARSPAPEKDPMALLETFAKLCVQLNGKSTNEVNNHSNNSNQMTRTQSHKSLQCEASPREEPNEVNNYPKYNARCYSPPENIPSSKIRSRDNFESRAPHYENEPIQNTQFDRQSVAGHRSNCLPYDQDYKYGRRLDNVVSRARNKEEGDLYHGYPADVVPTGTRMDYGYRQSRMSVGREYDNHRELSRRQFEEEKRKESFVQNTSRSFEVPREGFDDDKLYHRTARSEDTKPYDRRNKRYDERDNFECSRRNEKDRHSNMTLVNAERARCRRSKQAFDKISIASRDDFPFKNRCSEQERDSGLSIADGDTSTVSGKSNCLRVVKQEIAEQREAMDKMMKLWKELMRCFKSISPLQQDPKAEKQINESAASAKESAAAQMQLWKECMRRYETVARDVGDTDTRLMEEINKQRSEMAEMATMWQECLQRYRDISDDFNNLKQKLTVPPPESPTRIPVSHAQHQLMHSEGEGVPISSYRVPSSYPTAMPQMPGYSNAGSPLRARASIPPAWWWGSDAPPSPRHRRDSPEAHRDRHRDRDRDCSRYKEKSSKPNGARSEHRHRKR